MKLNQTNNWLTCRMQEIASIYNGNSISEEVKARDFTGLATGYNYIATKDVGFDSIINYENGVKIPFTRKDFKVAPKNTPLLCIEGGSAGRKLGFLSEDVCFGNKLCAFVSPFSQWIYYYLQSHSFRNHFNTNKNGLIGGVSINKLKQISIPLPPMAEQKRIVKKIEELFAVIDKNIQKLEHTQQALIQYRQSVLQQAFSGKLYKTTNWDNYFFSDLCTYIQRGKSPKYTEQSSLPVINQKCIRWNELQTQYLKFIDPIQFQSWTKERHVQPMDILWNSTGTGTIGRAYLYKGTELSDAVVDSHVTILRANPVKVLPHFLFLYIQSPFVQQKIEKMQSGSTNQVELARKEIQNISISLPSLPEQKAIVEKIEKAFACADKAQAAISAAWEQAKQLKQSILKRAFEGRLVPQDPNDNPVDLTQLKKDKHK